MHFFGAQCLDLTSTVSREALCRRLSSGSPPAHAGCREPGRGWPSGGRNRPRWDRRQRLPQARGPVPAHSASPEGTLEGLGLFSDQAELFEVCGTVSVWTGLGPLLFYWGISIPQNPAERLERLGPRPPASHGGGGAGRQQVRAAHSAGFEVSACLFTNTGSQAAGKQTVWKRGTQLGSGEIMSHM